MQCLFMYRLQLNITISYIFVSFHGDNMLQVCSKLNSACVLTGNNKNYIYNNNKNKK